MYSFSLGTVSSQPNSFKDYSGTEDHDHHAMPSSKRKGSTPTRKGTKRKKQKRGSVSARGELINNDMENIDICPTTPRDSASADQSFACPYYKKDPLQHSRCVLQKFNRISHMKQHIRRKHTQPCFCDRCGAVFKRPTLELSAGALKSHLRGSRCECKDFSAPEGLTPEQSRFLEKRVSAKQTRAEQWCTIWQQLFSGHQIPDSPFIDDPVNELLTFQRQRAPHTIPLVLQTLNLSPYQSVPGFNGDLATLCLRVYSELQYGSTGDLDRVGPSSDLTPFDNEDSFQTHLAQADESSFSIALTPTLCTAPQMNSSYSNVNRFVHHPQGVPTDYTAHLTIPVGSTRPDSNQIYDPGTASIPIDSVQNPLDPIAGLGDFPHPDPIASPAVATQSMGSEQSHVYAFDADLSHLANLDTWDAQQYT